jgi:hypothetical protein
VVGEEQAVGGEREIRDAFDPRELLDQLGEISA